MLVAMKSMFLLSKQSAILLSEALAERDVQVQRNQEKIDRDHREGKDYLERIRMGMEKDKKKSERRDTSGIVNTQTFVWPS